MTFNPVWLYLTPFVMCSYWYVPPTTTSRPSFRNVCPPHQRLKGSPVSGLTGGSASGRAGGGGVGGRVELGERGGAGAQSRVPEPRVGRHVRRDRLPRVRIREEEHLARGEHGLVDGDGRVVAGGGDIRLRRVLELPAPLTDR